MRMRRVLEWGMQRRSYVSVEEGATKGATVGRDLLDADGDVWNPDETVVRVIEQHAASKPPSYGTTLWRFIKEIPANIRSLAGLDKIGFAARINAGGEWANRIITGAPDRVTVKRGDGVAVVDYLELNSGGYLDLNGGGYLLLNSGTGNPFIDLAAVPDSGAGSLRVFDKDGWGRVTGSRLADPYDLPQGIVVKEVLDADFTIREDYQLIVYDSFEVNGGLAVEGKLVIL